MFEGRQARMSKLKKASKSEGNNVEQQHRISAAWSGEEVKHGSEEKAGRSPGFEDKRDQAASSVLLTCNTIVLQVFLFEYGLEHEV